MPQGMSPKYILPNLCAKLGSWSPVSRLWIPVVLQTFKCSYEHCFHYTYNFPLRCHIIPHYSIMFHATLEHYSHIFWKCNKAIKQTVLSFRQQKQYPSLAHQPARWKSVKCPKACQQNNRTSASKHR